MHDDWLKKVNQSLKWHASSAFIERRYTAHSLNRDSGRYVQLAPSIRQATADPAATAGSHSP